MHKPTFGGGWGSRTLSDPPDASERALDKTATEHAQVLAQQDTCAERPQQAEGQNLALPEHLSDRVLRKKCAVCVPCDSGPNGEASLSGEPPEETIAPIDLQQLVELWYSIGPDLREAVAAFPELPDAVKAGIVAMVRVALGNERAGESEC